MIPFKGTKKNMTIFLLYFLPKKSKIFDILVIKTFFFSQTFGYFEQFKDFFKDLKKNLLEVLRMRSSI